MAYQHSNVYVVRVVDTDLEGETRTWLVGPYGSARADEIADELAARGQSDGLRERRCHVEALFSDEDCLRVHDYGRAEHGSLV